MLYVLTIPQAQGDLYTLPAEVLTAIRNVVCRDIYVRLEAPSQVSLFVYDNDTFIVESFRESMGPARIVTDKRISRLRDLVTGRELSGPAPGRHDGVRHVRSAGCIQRVRRESGRRAIAGRNADASIRPRSCVRWRCRAARRASAPRPAHVWELQEIELRSSRTYANPYVDVECWVELKGPGFSKRVYGFWDGGDVFRVRLVATAPGAVELDERIEPAGGRRA